MDRFTVKEPRAVAGFPQGNQIMAFHSNGISSHMIPTENIYYSNYANVQQTVSMPPTMDSHHAMTHSMNSPHPQHAMGHTQTFTGPSVMSHGLGQSSGIDSRYLAAYGDSNQQYIMTGQQIQRNQPPINSFGNDYQNRSFTGPERNKLKTVQGMLQGMLQPQVMALGGLEPSRVEEMSKPYTVGENKKINTSRNNQNQQSFLPKFHASKVEEISKPYNEVRKSHKQNPQPFPASNELTDIEVIRMNVQTDMMKRTDKLKALHKGGPRVFSGPVEKVLKWHKSLQDIGILIIYEIVAKCVSIRPGEKCAKNLVVRDDNGPAIQVVYYEIDFLLPELKPPCTVRVIGKLMPGTIRLQAFNVRPATGDDVATLPRRAAVAAHHVAKLCKDYVQPSRQP